MSIQMRSCHLQFQQTRPWVNVVGETCSRNVFCEVLGFSSYPCWKCIWNLFRNLTRLTSTCVFSISGVRLAFTFSAQPENGESSNANKKQYVWHLRVHSHIHSMYFHTVFYTPKTDLKFSGPIMLNKNMAFDINMKIFRFPGCGPERKKWTPPMQKCTFRSGHPFSIYKIKGMERNLKIEMSRLNDLTVQCSTLYRGPVSKRGFKLYSGPFSKWEEWPSAAVQDLHGHLHGHIYLHIYIYIYVRSLHPEDELGYFRESFITAQ